MSIAGAMLGVSASLLAADMDAAAEEFTAGTVMSKMGSDERFFYITGIVEGLAYARHAKDGQKTDGMGCIYDWFYKGGGTSTKIEAAFTRFPDYTPGAVIAAMVGKECGS